MGTANPIVIYQFNDFFPPLQEAFQIVKLFLNITAVYSFALPGIVTVTIVPPPSLGAIIRLPPHMISSLS